MPAEADFELLGEIIAREGISTHREPGAAAYVDALRARFLDLLTALFGEGALARDIGEILIWSVIISVIIAVSLLALPLLRALAGRSASSRSPSPPPTRKEALPEVFDPDALFESALAEGRIREALGVLWTGLALRVTERGMGAWRPDLTHREFIETVPDDWPPRADLLEFSEVVDRNRFGPRVPDEAAVRALAARGRDLVAD